MATMAHSSIADMDAIEEQGRRLDEQEARQAPQAPFNPFHELEALCREWRELVREDHQKGWTDYADEHVGCYFAVNSDHTAVRIGDFEVSFHPRPQIGFKICDWPTLPSAIAKGRSLLERERVRRAQVSVGEKEAAKEARRAALLKQLHELEAV